MAQAVSLETERLLVGTLTPREAPAVLRFFVENREHLEPWSPEPVETFYTEAYWRERLKEAARELRGGTAVRLFVRERESPRRVVGTANLTHIVRGAFHACYLGYSIARDRQGRGLMGEALRAVIDYAFGDLRLHRIMANYMPRNARSAKVLERLGFVTEGTAREYLMIAGRWEDHVLTSLTNPAWRPL